MTRPARRLRRIAGLAVLVALLAGCSSDAGSALLVATAPTDAPSPSTTIGSTPPTSASDPADPTARPITWKRCGRLDCGTLDVPLDHARPGGPTITLHMKRRKAGGKRIGTLLVNPGGPGVPAQVLADQADDVYSLRLRDRFDIVAVDLRGTGESSVVRCDPELDRYLDVDPSPDDAAESQQTETVNAAFNQSCLTTSGIDLLSHVSTADAAKDLDLVRAALGEDRISYFGFSYGSELGATYATLFPEHVRAAVLDGSISPSISAIDLLVQQVQAVDALLTRMFERCRTDSGCPFGEGDPDAAFARIVKQVDTTPLPTTTETDRPPVGQMVMGYAVVASIYDQSSWPSLLSALGAAEQGDGTGLRALADGYFERQADGTYPPLFGSLTAVSCLIRDRWGSAEAAAARATLERTTRLADLVSTLDGCDTWPVPPVPQPPITGLGAGPILVVGAVNDPVTTLESTTAMANALEGGTLVVRTQGEGHTSYTQGDACIVNAVDDYLVDLVTPPDGTRC